MNNILYYSNYCNNCKNLLQDLAKSQEKKDIHFICIDQRIQKNGKIYIVLQNSQEILLPPQINKVPALLFLNQKDQNIIFGEEINNILKPTENLSPIYHLPTKDFHLDYLEPEYAMSNLGHVTTSNSFETFVNLVT